MSLSARAIALQGVGFSAGLLAVQGLADFGAAVVIPVQPASSTNTGRIIYVHGPSPWAVRRKRRDEALLLGHRWEL